jgi:5-carboxymethyl-2-hydroxymuconate isomerase
MRLMRVGEPGAERPAMMDDSGTIRDLSGVVPDIAGEALSDSTLGHLRALEPAGLPALDPDIRIGPCVGGIGKVICVGLNYEDHARETGAAIPTEPVLFAKAVSAISGPDDPIPTPRESTALDYEVELAIVIGRRTQYVSETEAMNHVAGFALFNDVSERDFQKHRGGQWTKGKSHDGFGPLGPWLVTRDAFDPSDAPLSLDVNRERRQTGSTARMIFRVPEIVSYVSQFMTLHPGDVIPTGTPPGVALGMTPPGFLRPGDVVELAIAGLGRQRQEVIPPV